MSILFEFSVISVVIILLFNFLKLILPSLDICSFPSFGNPTHFSLLLPCPLLKYLKGALCQFPGRKKKALSRPILRAVPVRGEEPDFLDSDKYKSLFLKLLLCPSCGNVQRND